MGTRTLIVAAAALAAITAGCSKNEPPAAQRRTAPPAAQLDRIVRHFNRGVAHMDRLEPAQAVADFESVVAIAPDWPTSHLNLGIALLNVQSDSARTRAEAALRRAADLDPGEPRAHYALGMLLRHASRFDEARTAFERVLQIDPGDADAHYQIGVLLADLDAYAAIGHLEATLARMPHHAPACYRLQGLLRQRGDVERSAELLARFEELQKARAGAAAGMKYGEMGRYAEVVRAFDLPPQESLASELPAYVDVAEASGLRAAAGGEPGSPAWTATGFGPGVAVADVDGDGALDVFLTASGPGGRGVLYRGDSGKFVPVPDTRLDGRDAVGAWFGDYDEDGDPDLYLTCTGPNRLYRNDGGRFTDVTASARVAGEDVTSLGAAWADADHDGDLDLYVANTRRGWRGAGNTLWRNNGDGTFRETAATAGIGDATAASVGVVFFDADADLDLDLWVLNRDADHAVFLNDRVGRYTDAGASHTALTSAGPALGAALADLDQDGREDLVLAGAGVPPRVILQPEPGRYVVDEAFAALAPATAAGVLCGDLDLDGDVDLVLLDAGAPGMLAHRVFRNRGAGRFESAARLGSERAAPRARGAVAADLDGDGMLELLVACAGAPPELWRAPLPPAHHWLTVAPASGTERHGTAIGLLVEVKAGRDLQVARIVSASGYLGSTPTRAHFGLGSHAKADYIRLAWPDAQLQSELEVAAGQIWTVHKVKRKASSCPILFSWSGERFDFVTDFLGVGGLGFFVAPGEYAPPDPTEDVRIPPAQVAEHDGQYLLRVAEPLEEVTYLDALHLIVYEHPADWEVYPDERFAVAPPAPTGAPRAVRDKIFPVAARDARGRDALDLLRAADRRSTEPPLDRRFLGFAADHAVEIDFGDRLRGLGDGTVLVLHGWIEYTYSHINYAAWQAGLALHPVSIEIPDGRGGWRVSMPDVGFPAGLPRAMTVDMTPEVIAAGKFRLRTNMQIYWDQVFAAANVAGPEVTSRVLHPVGAELRFLGYPREYSPDGAEPTCYDYDRVDQGVPFKGLLGRMTRFGDVRPLLASADDRFVVFGRGEELALAFDAASLPALEPGRRRTLVLHVEGYCKDMDLYTAHPATIEPLPYRGMANYPPPAPHPDPEAVRRYALEWNTRRFGTEPESDAGPARSAASSNREPAVASRDRED